MNTKTTPKDFFMHLSATVALYVSVASLINLAFSVINYAFPDVLAGYFSTGSVIWPISILIILTPAFYILEWLIKKDLIIDPSRSEIWIRRWRIYLTLFITGIAIIADLITLLNIYLGGEITSRFIYKVLVVFVVAGLVFAYYLLERRYEPTTKSILRNIIIWASGVIVILVIIGGFIIVGSPAKQRALKMDNQRINDLSNIQWQIINYWQQKSSIPAGLEELNDSISKFNIPVDPVSKAPYEYEKKGTNSFSLCANFSLDSQDLKGRGDNRGGYYDIAVSYPYGDKDESWTHPTGRKCFDRTIDPERYPPYKR